MLCIGDEDELQYVTSKITQRAWLDGTLNQGNWEWGEGCASTYPPNWSFERPLDESQRDTAFLHPDGTWSNGDDWSSNEPEAQCACQHQAWSQAAAPTQSPTVSCPNGTFHDTGGCTPCPAGTFSDDEGAKECKVR